MATKSLIRIASALALAIGFAVSPAAQAQSLEAFGTACNANPTFFDFTGIQLGADPAAHQAVCGCLGEEFVELDQAELTMLIKDVEGTATVEDREAYGDYAALEGKARIALVKCFASAGLTEEEPAAPATNTTGEPADMTVFGESCNGSALLLGMVGDEEQRTGLCGCLVETLAPKVTTEDANVLGADLAGTSTEESKAAYAGYAAASAIAGQAFETCVASSAQ